MSSKKPSNKHRKIIIISIISSLFLLILITCSLIYIKQATLMAKTNKAKVNLGILSQSLYTYYNTHGSFPDLLTNPGFTDPIPEDPFADGPLKYLNLNDGAYVCIYSVGEDGIDNLAMHDIVEDISIDKNSVDSGLFGNLQIELINDPDNGMPFFIRALQEFEFGSSADFTSIEKAKIVNEFGWTRTINSDKELLEKFNNSVRKGDRITEFDLAHLEDLIAKNKASFDFIRQGARKPYSKVILEDKNIAFWTHIPNFMRYQLLSRLMISEGKMLEFQGDPEGAVGNYLDLIKFAHSAAAYPNLIGKFVDLALEREAYKALQDCLAENKFDSEILAEINAELGAMKSPSIAKTYKSENLAIKNAIKDVRLFSKSFFTRHSSFWKGSWNNLIVLTQRKRIIKNSNEVLAEINKTIGKPYHELKNYNYNGLLDGKDMYNRINTTNVLMTFTSDYCVRAHASASMTIVGLVQLKMEKDKYPDDLSSFPTDPFTDKPFLFIKDTSGFQLYSPGPDLMDGKARTEYDPTNGIISAGDIIFPILH
jgi:hypothetical protein